MPSVRKIHAAVVQGRVQRAHCRGQLATLSIGQRAHDRGADQIAENVRGEHPRDLRDLDIELAQDVGEREASGRRIGEAEREVGRGRREEKVGNGKRRAEEGDFAVDQKEQRYQELVAKRKAIEEKKENI